MSETKRNLIVQKYGGATLSDPAKVKHVARRIADASKNGRVVAVVSAMGKTTNQLIDLAGQIAMRPKRREMDMLLTTGERISMALVSIALNDIGCEAISYTGSQAGILTDDAHVNAFIQDVKAFRVEEAVNRGQVVVLAGFQGVSPFSKEITTLGRGGTDTTAVAMAAYLKAERCEILKDVESVYSGDPKLIPTAKKISYLNYDQLCEMTFWGAKVLHYRSVELAKRMGVRLYVGPAANSLDEGTIIEERIPVMYESAQVLAVNSNERVLALDTAGKSVADGWKNLQEFLNRHEIAFPQVLTTELQDKGVRIFVTGPSEILKAIVAEAAQSATIRIFNGGLSSVTATCAGSTSPVVNESILSHLQAGGVEVLRTLMSPMSTTVLVRQEDRDRALQELHRLIR